MVRALPGGTGQRVLAGVMFIVPCCPRPSPHPGPAPRPNRRSKRPVRSRMAQTGEKYRDARRALVAAGGHSGGAGEGPGGVITWPADSLGWFTDQAYNAILLAVDEARMLSHPRVEPEHLL